MEPQQLDVKELFATIGELTVQLRVANQMIVNLQQEKARLGEDIKKAKEDKK